MHNNRNHWFDLLILAIIGAFVAAVVFVVVQSLTLPPSDGAYGNASFADPLVLPIMSIGAGFAGLAAFPFSFWLLRRSDLRRSFWTTTFVTLVVMIIVMAAGGGPLGLPCSFITMVCSMAYCRSRFPLMPQEASNKVMQTDVGCADITDRTNR
jgi:peptidoglycan/LPS O-acetylase OafA/YrhL